MNAYDRPTDSLPISRRMVIMKPDWQRLPSPPLPHAPITEPRQLANRLGRTLERYRWVQRCRRTLSASEADIPCWAARSFPTPGQIAQPEGRVQGVQFNLPHQGLRGGRGNRHDQLPVPWQQILDHRRFGGESSRTPTAACQDDQGRRGHAHRYVSWLDRHPKAIISLSVASPRLPAPGHSPPTAAGRASYPWPAHSTPSGGRPRSSSLSLRHPADVAR